jgi:tRNA-specific adenosine deaminase 3
LKRIRRLEGNATLLLSLEEPPVIPAEFDLAEPYCTEVPESVALTPTSLKRKSKIWPTVYAPRRKGEPEAWTRARAAWAWDAVRVLQQEARNAMPSIDVRVL